MKTKTDMEDLLDVLERDMQKTGASKMSKKEAHKKGLCIICGQPAKPNCYSEKGHREYKISGVCELCFDKSFQEE